MSADLKTNEWNLLKHQFNALAHEESADNDGIERIYDAEFRHRFTELIDQTAHRNSTSGDNWPRRSPMEYQGQKVGYWHKADMLIAAWNVRYWG